MLVYYFDTIYKQVEAELSQAQLHLRLALLEFHHFDEKLSIEISLGGLLNWWINFALVNLAVFGHFLTFLGVGG